MQDTELKQESCELKNNMFPMHLYIMDKVPSYGCGQPKGSMQKIKECLRKMEYDEEFMNYSD